MDGVVTGAVEVEHSPCGIWGGFLYSGTGTFSLIEVRTSKRSERRAVEVSGHQFQPMTSAGRKAALPQADRLESPLEPSCRKGLVSGEATEEPWLQG